MLNAGWLTDWASSPGSAACRARPPKLYCGMKTAISLPDDLHRSGDALAKRMGLSRSELYARALAEYVAKHRASQVTQRLNAVYAAEDGRLDPAVARAQGSVLARERW